MNPYLKNQTMIQTMPFPKQLSALHARAAYLCKTAYDQFSDPTTQDQARQSVEDFKEILIFLISSLDTKTEAGQKTDATFRYFLGKCILWITSGTIEQDVYDTMVSTMMSWAATWEKIPAEAMG